MQVKTSRPTEAHINELPEYIGCHGDGHIPHPIWRNGDLWHMTVDSEGRGWICGFHLAQGKAEMASQIVSWHAVRGRGRG